MVRSVYLLALTFILTSCLFERDKVTVTGLPSEQMKAVAISSVKIENDRLVVTGSNLEYINSLRLTKPGSELNLDVVNQNGQTIVAKLKDNSKLLLSQVEQFFDLVLANAYAQTVIPVSFVLGNFGASDGQVLVFNASSNQWMPQTAGLASKAIGLSHLSTMGAIDGDSLVFDETRQEWTTRALSGLNFQGTIDPVAASYSILASSNVGDYYIASSNCSSIGTCITSNDTYAIGDWIVYSSAGPQKISNATGVDSFFGVQGSIGSTPNQEFAGFKINQLGNVDTGTPATNDVLMYNGTNWFADGQLVSDVADNATAIDSLTTSLNNISAVPTTREVIAGTGLSGGGPLSSNVTLNLNYDTSTLELNTNTLRLKAGGVADSHITAGGLSISKISGLQTALDLKQPENSNLTALAGLTLGANQILKTTGSSALSLGTFSASDVGLGNVINTLQLTSDDILSATDLGTSATPSTTKAPSQSAVVGYVTSAISTVNTGNLKTDGSTPLTGALQLSDTNTGSANWAKITAPDTVTTNYTLTLPTALGTDNQVLKVSSAGVLATSNIEGLKTACADDQVLKASSGALTCATDNGSSSVSTTRAINTQSGSGLTGGGDLSTDRNISIVIDSSLNIATNTLGIKSAGVTDVHLAAGSIKHSHASPSDEELESCANDHTLVWLTPTGWTCTSTTSLISSKQDSSAQLTTLAALTPADGAFIIGNGTSFVTESGDTAKTSIGLANVTNDAQLTTTQLSTQTDLDDGSGASNTLIPSQLAVKTYVDNMIDTNTSLTANSDTKVASQKAVKTFVQTFTNPTVREQITSYTVTTSDNNALILASGVDTIISLPTAASAGNGFRVTIKRTDPDHIISVSAPEFIDNRDNIFYYQDYTTITYFSNGTKWYLDSYPAGISAALDDAPAICPTGFIPVPGNSELGTTGFCVAKYEMKDAGGGVFTSTAAGNPYVSISANTSFTKCAAMTSSLGGTFALISNAEWMTIARNIEQVASNWSTGVIGSGVVARGHTDNDPAGALAVASTTDPYNGTNNSTVLNWEQRRTLTLSNGQVIWDFSGNVWEWVDWDSTDGAFTLGPTDCAASWNEFSTSCSSLTTNQYKPTSGYTSSQGLGRWYGGTVSGGAALRGGGWYDGTYAGAFTLYLSHAATNTRTHIGARCRWLPASL